MDGADKLMDQIVEALQNNDLDHFKSLKLLADMMDVQMLVESGIQNEFAIEFMKLLDSTV